jgi:hypothetical protein
MEIITTTKTKSGFVVEGTEGKQWNYVRKMSLSGEWFTTDTLSVVESWNGYGTREKPRGSKVTHVLIRAATVSAKEEHPNIYLISGFILNDPSRFTLDGWNIDFTDKEVEKYMDENRKHQVVPRGSSLEKLFWNLHFSDK